MIANGYGLSEVKDSDVVTYSLIMYKNARKELQGNLEKNEKMDFGSNKAVRHVKLVGSRRSWREQALIALQIQKKDYSLYRTRSGERQAHLGA